MDKSPNPQNKAHVPANVPSRAAVLFSALAAGLGVGFLSLLVEYWLQYPRALTLTALSDQFVAAVTAAVCVWVLSNNSRKRRLLNRQRFELIRESTQQIRQALQLITDTAEPGSKQQHVVIYAVDHIEWVLQEVLPTLHQEPKEVQARLKDTSTPEIFTH